METKHTPAPWFSVNYAGNLEIQDANDYNGKSLLDYEDIGEEQAEANARLIIAAPELLEALIKIKSIVNKEGSWLKNTFLSYGVNIDEEINKATK